MRSARVDWLLCMVLALLLNVIPGAAAEITDSAGQTIDQALDAQVSEAREMRSPNIPQKYNPQASVDLLQSIVAAHPDYYRARYGLALSLYAVDAKKSEDYLPVFDQAIAIQERHPEIADGSIYNTVGWIRLNNREYDAAEGFFIRALRLENKNTAWTNSATYYNLGRLYFEKSDFQKSLNYLNVAVDTYANPAAIALRSAVLAAQAAT